MSTMTACFAYKMGSLDVSTVCQLSTYRTNVDQANSQRFSFVSKMAAESYLDFL